MTLLPKTRALLLAVSLSVSGLFVFPAMAADGEFETVKAKTFDKKKFLFPADLAGDPVNVLFLAMSNDQDIGQEMPPKMIDWHVALAQAGAFSERAMPYHFVVISGAPFFVKGLISGAMRDMYDGKVPLNQSATLFVDDLDEFAQGAGLTINDKPMVVVAASDGKPLFRVEGEVSDTAVTEVMAAITKAGGVAP